MSVRLDGGTVRLEGDCHVEDAETLLRFLLGEDRVVVDMSQCRHLHGAVLQVLLSFGPQVVAGPTDPFLRDHLTASLDHAAVLAEKK